jgi:hypothetical protein
MLHGCVYAIIRSFIANMNDEQKRDDHEQGTAGWHEARLGHVTASRISDVLTKPRKGQRESITRRNYRGELVAQILSGKAQEDFQTWEMRRGLELEPFARAEYEIKRGLIVTKIGFIKHPSVPRCGASPDGFVGEDGLVQFKAPKTAIHLDYLMAKIVPAEYRPQMLLELSVTGRQWNDFCSFDPNMPDHLQLFVVRLKRDETEIAEIENEVMKFNAEVDEIIAKLSVKLDEDLTQVLTDSVRAVHVKEI